MFGTYVNRESKMNGPFSYFGKLTTASPCKVGKVDIRKSDGEVVVSPATHAHGITSFGHTFPHSITRCPKTSVHARWLSLHESSRQRKPRWFREEAAKLGGANVFESAAWGSTFMMVSQERIEVPLVDAVKYAECLSQYNGSKLVKFGEPFPISKMAQRTPRGTWR